MARISFICFSNFSHFFSKSEESLLLSSLGFSSSTSLMINLVACECFSFSTAVAAARTAAMVLFGLFGVRVFPQLALGKRSPCYTARDFPYPLSKTSALHQFALCHGLGLEVYVGLSNH